MAFKKIEKEFDPIWAGIEGESMDAIVEDVAPNDYGGRITMKLLKGAKLTVKGKDGEKAISFPKDSKIVLPNHASLASLMGFEKGKPITVAKGERYLIEQVGYLEGKNGKSDTNLYDVSRWEE